ncbi:MAG TPA: hypothetical protein VMK66_14475 [Myxococcales bacterium]|nr:hypothetical protein [Myxococcales bacterium]
METLAIALVTALALAILFRRPGAFAPALVLAGQGTSRPLPAPGDDEEQLPETDRAPRRWLPLCVACLAVLRLVLVLTLHA